MASSYPRCDNTKSTTRITSSGRTFRYELSIEQEPLRARACGSGAKASADRRPVDPPPILALRLFEQTAPHVEQEISFSYQATWFMYVSLKSDRRFAQPRNMPSVNNDKKDVLAGQIVAAGSPYERPHAAQYFIFPDLSVRHEGKYHLEFMLYEHAKSPGDESRPDGQLHAVTSPCGLMSINSRVFDVYSAKRFPGLTESTALSRILAEQGSRIRIRRDVRMRKQDTKAHAKNWEGYDEDGSTEHAGSHTSRMPQTPDPYNRPTGDVLQRPPSVSNRGITTHDALSRRTSLNDLSQPYLVQQQQQQQSQQSSSQSLFNNPPTAYNNMSGQSYSQQSFMHPPPPQYSAGYQPQSAIISQQQQQQHNYYPYTSSQVQPIQYPPITTAPDSSAYQQRTSADYTTLPADSRRGSMQSVVATGPPAAYNQPSTSSQQLHSVYSQATPLYAEPLAQPAGLSIGQQQQQQQQSQNNDPFAPRSQSGVADPHASAGPTSNPAAMAAKAGFPTKLPPLSTSLAFEKMDPASPIGSAAPASAFSSSTLHTPTDSNKRAYGSTFATSWQNISNKQGARPGDSVFGPASMKLAPDTEADGSSDTFETYDRPVTYRRAGGATATRTHIQ